MEPLVNYFIDIKIKKILDVGTGEGGFIPVLLKTFPGSEVTAIDPNTESLKVARQKFPGIQFLEMEAEKLKFQDDQFDVVSLSMALHHFPKVKKALKEIKRVAKPGAYIIINEPISDRLNAAQEVHKMYHHFRSRIDRLLGTFHRQTFTSTAILQMLKTAELPVQFYFEHRNNAYTSDGKNELEARVETMKQMLEKIKDRPEYEQMLPQVEEFRRKSLKNGFQMATNLVIVIRKISLPR